MALLNIYESEVSTEFKNFLDQIKTNIEAYSEAKLKAQKERMIIIGKIAEYKQSFPQRSTDHRLLVKAMKEDVLLSSRLGIISSNSSRIDTYL